MQFFNCLLVFGATLGFASARGCEKPCTKIFRPVCGSDGEHFKVFSNPCILQNEHCKDGHVWFQTRTDDCQELVDLEEEERCERPCPRIYKPVCGSDGDHVKVFPNSCELQNEHCRDGHIWVATRAEECHVDEEEEKCKIACPFIYRPVCGFDGQTYQQFPNKCIMDAENCLKKYIWTQTSIEHCQSDEEVSNCLVKCPMIFAPVCGFDGQTYKRFPNKCMMNADSCLKKHKFIQSRFEQCEHSEEDFLEDDCPLICPALYAPVCGFDGQVYKRFVNKCEMNVERCRRKQNWVVAPFAQCAQEDDDDDCPLICPALYAPVCGFDGQVYKRFDNKCRLDVQNCRLHHNWTVTTLNECAGRA